jgi:hypothetical protein
MPTLIVRTAEGGDLEKRLGVQAPQQGALADSLALGSERMAVARMIIEAPPVDFPHAFKVHTFHPIRNTMAGGRSSSYLTLTERACLNERRGCRQATNPRRNLRGGPQHRAGRIGSSGVLRKNSRGQRFKAVLVMEGIVNLMQPRARATPQPGRSLTPPDPSARAPDAALQIGGTGPAVPRGPQRCSKLVHHWTTSAPRRPSATSALPRVHCVEQRTGLTTRSPFTMPLVPRDATVVVLDQHAYGVTASTAVDCSRSHDQVGEGNRTTSMEESVWLPSAGPCGERILPVQVNNRGGLRARSPAGQGTEAMLACNILNQMTQRGRPASYAVGR